MEENTTKSFQKALENRIRGDVSFDEMTLGIYSTDAGFYQMKPVAVVLPVDDEDVKAAVKTAAEFGISILPRGGGTSLGGQAIGHSMILDFTRYMNKIIELNAVERWVRVQPGIVLDNLNAELARHGLLFAPDPATSSRAAIGGLMGNNSSGTKSIIYGLTRDHVLESRILLADGTEMELKELSPEEYEQKCGSSNENRREAEIYGKFKEIIEKNREEIGKRYPKVMRRVQGYNLDAFTSTANWDLNKLIIGSEGSLAVILEAKLNLVPLPKKKILCTIHFSELQNAISAVEPILLHKPSAVEVIDSDLMTGARNNLNIAPLCGFIEGDPKGILIVEFYGDTQEEVRQKAEKLVVDMQNQQRGYAWPIIEPPDEQAKVWAVRKNGLGLIIGMKGDRKPIAFIEDSCVPVEVLPEYVDRIIQFCKGLGVSLALYAHASVGTIHLRPILNLKEQKSIDQMKAIAEFSFGLIQKYGGSLSGEHGDGRVRSPLLERFFGPTVYGALREVKELFDPAGLMNPGVIIDPEPIDHNLRYGPTYKTPDVPTVYHYREDGSFAGAVEMCSGIGVCRQTLTATMCPSFRATLDEEHTTRGRANALRLAMTGQLGPDALTGKRLYEVLDLCLSCKGCKSDCPSNVDLARLKSEFLQKYHDAHGFGLRERIVAGSPNMSALISGWMAPFVNFFQKTYVFRKTLEIIAGFDCRRRLPEYAFHKFPVWFKKHSKTNGAGNKKVVLFNDTYMNFHETNVGISAVELLESCGYEVILANAGCCQRPGISHGFLRKAKKEGEKTLRNLDKFIQQGLQIVVCEPGCCSALTDDLPDLIEDEQLGKRIKSNVMMIDEFLYREILNGNLDCSFTSPYNSILIHGHCHQKSLYGTTSMKEVLGRVPDIKVTEVDSGCCGMAGSFGYEKEHYDLSMQIGEDRLFPAVRNREEGTAVVACGFSCRHQIDHGTGVKALHWVETLRGNKQ